MADSRLTAEPASVVLQLSALLRQAQTYELTNTLMVNAIAGFTRLLRAVAGEEELLVDLVADSFFVNKALVKLSGSSFEASDSLKKILVRLDVQRVRFGAGITEEDLGAFLAAYQRALKAAQPSELKRAQGRVTVSSVKYAVGDAGSSIDARQNVLRMYARLAVLLKDAVGDVVAGKPFRTPLLRKTVQGLVQASEGHEALLAGLTRFSSFRGDLHFHLGAVTALTLLMARRLALPRTALIDVAMAAAFHDLGRARQPVAGARPEVAHDSMLLAVRDGFSAEALIQAVAAWDVGVSAHQSGIWAPGALGRFIAVPCAFDLLTTVRPGAKALLPDQALRVIGDAAGNLYDPRVVKLFTSTVGVFPIGSTVRLSNGHIAVVLDVPRDARSAGRPLVKIIRDASGPCDVLVDLATDPRGLAIAASIDAAQARVNPARFMLA